MERFVHLFEVLIGDVGVALGGGDTRVTEERLHTAQVSPILE